jgi:hypothetical protein
MNENETQYLFEIQLKFLKIVHNIVHLVSRVLDSAGRNKYTNLPFQ